MTARRCCEDWAFCSCPPEKLPSSVYFIQEAGGGPIKIGFGSDPEHRLQTLQVGNPRPLRLIGAFGGGLREERALHRRFRMLRIAGEWFRPDVELLGFIVKRSTRVKYPEVGA